MGKSFKLNTDTYIKPIYYNIMYANFLNNFFAEMNLFGMKGQL